MNPITDIIFTLTWFILLVWAIRTMAKGWGLMTQPIQKSDVSGVYTTQVTRPVHPEMKDVQPGTELMGVNFEQKTECSLEEYKDLQARIEQLREELGGDDEEEDDDGGDVVIARV
tara:strand:- start:508 stop:852 length:345 start_codon:yes stop_codon:yes gene_type:complete